MILRLNQHQLVDTDAVTSTVVKAVDPAEGGEEDVFGEVTRKVARIVKVLVFGVLDVELLVVFGVRDVQ